MKDIDDLSQHLELIIEKLIKNMRIIRNLRMSY